MRDAPLGNMSLRQKTQRVRRARSDHRRGIGTAIAAALRRATVQDISAADSLSSSGPSPMSFRP